MYRPKQSTKDVVVVLSLMKRDGTMASQLNASYFYTKVIGPDGAQVTGYTAPTITEPNNDGFYVLKFPTTALAKAFDTSDEGSPYELIFGSTVANVIPVHTPVWIYEP